MRSSLSTSPAGSDSKSVRLRDVEEPAVSSSAVSQSSANGEFLAPGAAAASLSVLPCRADEDQETPQVFPARTGDYPGIHQLLLAVFHAPSLAEFQSSQDDPNHEPCDRLLIKQQGRLLAHISLTRRVMRFGRSVLPICDFQELATLPEYRGRRFSSRLLKMAENRALRDGAVLAMTRTRAPGFYASHGWVAVARHSYSRANARNILAHLDERNVANPLCQLAAKQRQLRIRLWRHVEQEQVMSLYEQSVAQSYGPLLREHEYWRWLVSRQGYDRIYVATADTSSPQAVGGSAEIIGYAVTYRERIVELCVADNDPDVATRLLARACADAIERDDHTLRFDGPREHILHSLMHSAGGSSVCREVDEDVVTMAKILDWPRFTACASKEFVARAKLAGLRKPLCLGLQVTSDFACLTISARRARFELCDPIRDSLQCSPEQLTQFILGHHSVSEAFAANTAASSTRLARKLSIALFPTCHLWRPSWDLLPANDL